jgi:hypothetical protein
VSGRQQLVTVAASSPVRNHLCTPQRGGPLDNQSMVKALAYPVHALCVISAVVVWIVVVPILDLLDASVREPA